jgi:hypothetical protein
MLMFLSICIRKGTKLSITLSITKIYKPYIMVELNLYKNKHGEP